MLFFDGTPRFTPLQALHIRKCIWADSQIPASRRELVRPNSSRVPYYLQKCGHTRSENPVTDSPTTGHCTGTIPFFAIWFRFSSSACLRARRLRKATPTIVSRWTFPSVKQPASTRADRNGHHCSRSKTNHAVRRQAQTPCGVRTATRSPGSASKAQSSAHVRVDTVKINMVSSRRFWGSSLPRALTSRLPFNPIFFGKSSAPAWPQHSVSE